MFKREFAARESVSFELFKLSALAMPGRGKRANSTAKAIIYHVYKYFEKESAKNKCRRPLKLTSKTAEATGYSERTVRRIVAKKSEMSGAAFTSPAKRYKVERKRIMLDDFDVEELRRLVHDFYREKKFPTLDSVLVAAKEKGIYEGERVTLWKLLHKMGFKHKKVNDKRYIYEQPRIIVQRHEYLRRLRRNRREGRPIIYLDETWANARDSMEKMWVEDDERAVGGTKGGVRKPSGKGSRLIILHAGCEQGWIDGAALVFQSKKSTGDYHDEMTSEHFEEWFHDSLMPNVPPNSLIVIDNAPYHSRRLEPVPTMSSRKQVMQDWLTAHGIEYPENALKRELHMIIKSNQFAPKYAVDEMAKASGHEVVRLPPYHCELNPIELAWSQVKRHIKENNRLFTLSAVKELTYEGFQKVGAERWKKLVEHVQLHFEDKYWVDDGLQEESIEEFVIRVGGSDDESSSDSSSESSDECDSD